MQKQIAMTDVNVITGDILDSCIKIHTRLGPGLFESVYEELLVYELKKKNREVVRQKAIPVVYDSVKFTDGFRADIIVNNLVIIEIKSIEHLSPVHFKQIHTYLKLAELANGVLVNFNVNLLKDGFFRVFNNHVKQ